MSQIVCKWCGKPIYRGYACAWRHVHEYDFDNCPGDNAEPAESKMESPTDRSIFANQKKQTEV